MEKKNYKIWVTKLQMTLINVTYNKKYKKKEYKESLKKIIKDMIFLLQPALCIVYK